MRGPFVRPAVFSIFGAMFLFACDPSQSIAVEGGIERAQQAKDAEARVLKASLCAMSIGAYHRVNDEAEQRALDVLCSGTADSPDGDDFKLKR